MLGEKRPRFQIYRADSYFWFVSCKFGRRRRKKIWLVFFSFQFFVSSMKKIFQRKAFHALMMHDGATGSPACPAPHKPTPLIGPLPPGQEVQSDRVHYVPKSDCEAFALRMRTAHVIFFLHWHEKTWWCFFCIWQPPLNCCYAKLHFFLFFLKGRIIKSNSKFWSVSCPQFV